MLSADSGLIEEGIDLGDGFNNKRLLGHIVNFQRGHEPGKHVQITRHLLQQRQWLIQLVNGFAFLNPGIQYVEMLHIGL